MNKRYPFLPKNWLRFSLTAAFAAAFSLNLQAQTAPVKLWDRSFGGSSYDGLTTMKVTSDGGYILGGFSTSGATGDKTQASNGSYDMWVVKVDITGNKVWDRSFGGSNQDMLYSIQQTTDGGYILGGISESGVGGDKTQPNLGYSDFWVIKLDASGNKVWDKTIGGLFDDQLYSIQQTTDGGFIAAGQSNSNIGGDKTQNGQGFYDYWIVKLDASGTKQWDKTFGGINGDFSSTVQQTTDGGYIIGGLSASDISSDKTEVSQGQGDYWIIKLNASGVKQWDKTIGGSGGDLLNSLQQTSDGGYILGGYSDSGISGNRTQVALGMHDFWVVKIDGAGNKIWDRAFGGNNDDDLEVINQTSDGGYILGGSSKSGVTGNKTQPSQGDWDYWIVRIDNNGNKIWDKTIGTWLGDLSTSLQQTTDGGYLIGGYTYSGINGDKTQASKGSSDFWIVKLGASPTGIKESEASFNLSISPNPNQSKFNLQLSNLTVPKAEVTISDLLGRVVLQKEIQATNNQFTEELTLPNTKGIYLLQLKAGEQFISRKIVIE